MPVFRPDDDAIGALTATSAQVDGVVVVDDGSGPESDAVIDGLRGRGAIVRRNDDNLGIAAALNAGIVIARERGATHVLFIDQDSRPQAGFVAALEDEEHRASGRGVRVGSIVPEVFASIRQARERPDGLLDAVNGIQSGMLVPLRVLDEVGPLRADFFIDLVDTEFELRLRRRGLAALAAPGLRLEHQLGHRFRRRRWRPWYRWMTLGPEVTLSTPFRYYYRLRNRLMLNRDYFWSDPRARGKETVADVIHFVDTVALSTERGRILRLYRRAVRDALGHRMGRMPDELAKTAAGIRWRADRVE